MQGRIATERKHRLTQTQPVLVLGASDTVVQVVGVLLTE